MTTFITFAKFLACAAIAGIAAVAIIFAICTVAITIKGTVEALKDRSQSNDDNKQN